MKTSQIMKLNNEPLSDKELLSNVINGQFDSFDVLVDRYKNRLLNSPGFLQSPELINHPS